MISKNVYAFLMILCFGCSPKPTNETKSDLFPVLKGPFMGQELPGITPVLFAPGIISNGQTNRDVAISPNGDEMYFGIHSQGFRYSSILVSKIVNGVWTRPEVPSFADDPRYSHLEPALTADGNKLFFLSNRSKDSTDVPGDEDIWVVDRLESGWSKPYNLGAPVNTAAQEFYPSLTSDGTLYFTRVPAGQRVHHIYRSRWVDGQYLEPELLPEQINCGQNRFNAYVAPDESCVIIPAIGVEEGIEGINYYLVKHNTDDTWEEPINLGEEINIPGNRGYSFSFSPDGKYAFFMASRTLEDNRQPDQLSYDFFLELATSPRNGNSDIFWFETSKIREILQ